MIEEKDLVYFVVAGGVLILLAYLWCLARAFGKGFGWGLLALVPPFFLLWAFSGPRRTDGKRAGGKGPVVLTLLGLVLIAGTFALNKYHAANPNLGPYEKLVDGQMHLTLTGWDRTDYAVLGAKKQAVVLQMANADVTNDTLKHLDGMEQLVELDLTESQIDDGGLAALAALPKLKVLRLARTKVTDEGFTQHLAAKSSLTEVDVRGTGVKGKTLRDWKNADKENRKYVGP
ncbi:MAG: hypothetical protein ACRC33_05170 [Gemmataceae bacterium]